MSGVSGPVQIDDEDFLAEVENTICIPKDKEPSLQLIRIEITPMSSSIEKSESGILNKVTNCISCRNLRVDGVRVRIRLGFWLWLRSWVMVSLQLFILLISLCFSSSPLDFKCYTTHKQQLNIT
jgi:hypothetical protein